MCDVSPSLWSLQPYLQTWGVALWTEGWGWGSAGLYSPTVALPEGELLRGFLVEQGFITVTWFLHVLERVPPDPFQSSFKIRAKLLTLPC